MNRLVWIMLSALTLSPYVSYGAEPIPWPARLALDGYDAVAYQTRGEAQRGSRSWSTRWREAEWRFVSEEHLRRFESDPDRYAPAYDGYGAWAMTRSERVQGDPQAWAVRDGRLFLMYSKATRTKWELSPNSSIRRADAAWQELKNRSGG